MYGPDILQYNPHINLAFSKASQPFEFPKSTTSFIIYEAYLESPSKN